MDEITENAKRIDKCPRHRFDGGEIKELNVAHTCLACGGKVNVFSLAIYLKGYRAAGGDVNDVWPGWGG